MTDSSRTALLADLLRVLLVVIFFGAIAWVLHIPWVRESLFDVTAWRQHLQGFGRSGVVAVLGVFVLANACGFPRLWISAIAGGLYGAVLGIAVALLATLVGATINFYTGRWLLGDLVRRRMPSRLEHWYRRFGDEGFLWILSIRLFPIGNATFVNLASGASPVSFAHFIGATFLGYLPYTLVFALFGSSAAKQRGSQLLLGAVLLAAVVLGQRLYRRRAA